jgi:lysozyme
MQRVGIKRGAYHFFRPALSAYNQAGNFTAWVEMESGDLPPVLDVEVLDGVSKIELINKVRTWLFLVEIKCNIKPIIYTNQKFYNKHLAGYFSDYPIWIARYSSWRKPHLKARRDWTFWQYGDKGQLNGIKGPVDFNVFRGNIFELYELSLAEHMVLSQR